MAQPATSAKIEELRARLKADPKSRLFYQLAEELRRAGQAAEAEQVLRSGVEVHPTYLAPWVSLGRVLRERKDDGGAVQALTRALQLDPGNVVAARLLGEAYLALGDKLEAIKKFKLVQALLPGDEELEGIVTRLDRELNPPPALSLSEPEPETSAEAAVPVADHLPPAAPPAPAMPTIEVASPFTSPEPGPAPAPVEASAAEETPVAGESPFDKTLPPFAEVADSFDRAAAGGDHRSEAPLEDPFAMDGPSGAEEQAFGSAPDELEPEPSLEAPKAFLPEGDDPADTLTMADLYARQGLTSEARLIYAKILTRDPENAEIRGKLAALDGGSAAVPAPAAKVVKLERWLARISGKEAGGV